MMTKDSAAANLVHGRTYEGRRTIRIKPAD